MDNKQKVKKVAFTTIGCKLNFAETSSISKEVEEYGFEHVGFDTSADLYVINTCIATKDAEQEFGTVVKDIKDKYPDAKIVAMGCYADNDPEKLASFKEVDLILGNINRFDLYHYFSKIENYDNQLVINESTMNKVINNNIIAKREHRKLNIAPSCDFYCIYCSIPLFDKNMSLRPLDKIRKSVEEVADLGVREVVLNGFNRQLKVPFSTEDLIRIIKEIETVEGISRIRFSALDFELLNYELIDVIADSEKMLPYFHLKVDSFSNKVLKKLGKEFNRTSIKKMVDYIHEAVYDPRIGFDIGVGFPGDSVREFEDAYDYLKELNFTFLHIFRSDVYRKSKSKLSETDMMSRIRKLKKLSDEKKLTFVRQNIGALKNVLFGHKRSNGYIFGLTENYIKVKAKYEPELENNISLAQLVELDNHGIVICELRNPIC